MRWSLQSVQIGTRVPRVQKSTAHVLRVNRRQHADMTAEDAAESLRGRRYDGRIWNWRSLNNNTTLLEFGTVGAALDMWLVLRRTGVSMQDNDGEFIARHGFEYRQFKERR